MIASWIRPARVRATGGSLLTYLTPLYASGGVVCLVWALVLEQPFHAVGGVDLLLIAGLVFGPTLAGHSIANWSMTVLRAQTVSLVNLTQFAFAGLLAFFAFGEVPGPVFFVTAALVVIGAGVALFPFGSQSRSKEPVEPT